MEVIKEEPNGSFFFLSSAYENAIYDFTINTTTKSTYLTLTIDNIPKFSFTVYEIHYDTSITGQPEQLTFKVSNTRKEFGDFTLYALT